MIVALAVFAVLGFGLVVGVALAVSWLRARRTWRGPGLIMHELICPMGELQDPQYLDRRRAADVGAFDAQLSAAAAVGLGIKAFANRAPLSVPPNEHSRRHG